MENDKQMNYYAVEKIKSIFLSDDLLVKNVKQEVYSLADEFAKSKKNKSILTFVLIFIYVAVIGSGSYFLTIAEENKNKRIDVNIAEFRQFNLVELLAEKKDNEEKLAQLQQELEDYRAKAMEQIKKLSPKEQQKAIADLNEKMKTLEESYSRQIKEKEMALAELERSINAEKQRIIAAARENEAVIHNYQNLAQTKQMENERLIREYEGAIAKLKADHQADLELIKQENQKTIEELIARYNPKFTRGEIASVINAKSRAKSGKTNDKYDRILAAEDVLSEAEFNEINKNVQSQRVLIKGLQEVGYENTVPAVLNKLDQLLDSLVIDYGNLWRTLAGRLREKNERLNSYDYALKYLAMTGRETGYVIDPRDPNRMIIFIDQIYSVKKGDSAYIFKNDSTPIAKIELYPGRGGITAKVKEVLKPIKIEPFDKILLKLEVAP